MTRKGRTLVSLRDLEQLVTRHSAVHPIEYFVDGRQRYLHSVLIAKVHTFILDVQTFRYVRVFEQYKSCVKANEKKNCDQFRRHNRVFIDCGIGRAVETTIGQMNFMLFAIQNGVITYAS